MIDLIKQCITMSIPLVLIALAGFFSERGGVINIGLEGKTLLACFFAVAFSSRFGPGIGLCLTIVATSLVSLLHWLLTQIYRMDHIISGMAINLLAAGATSFFKFKFAPDGLDDAHSPPKMLLYALGIIAPALLWWLSHKTRFGLQHRSAGSDPDKARLLGINPQGIRFVGLIGTGVLCALAGSLLIAETPQFTDGMTSGRGYIALAALILGGWRPVTAALACLLFGAASALQIQYNGQYIPSEAWKSLPYLVTLLAIAGFLGRNRTPAGLGKP